MSADKYKHLSKDELLKIIEKQEKELKTKKYGLLWDAERIPENVVMECAENLPILKRIDDKEIKTDHSDYNILIEGDNYHALTVLNYTHKEKIDVIYIDPPYNVGKKTWKYNNKYVEKDDGYRHSKWLNMMEKRLRIAKNLLKKDGVLIVAIDENEFANLDLLLKKIFGNYKIDQVVVVHNPRGIQGKNFSYVHEYALFVYPNDGKKYIGNIERENLENRNLRDNGGESLREDAKNCFFPIYVKNDKIFGFGDVCMDEFHPEKNVNREDGIIEVYPIDNKGIERKWRYSRQSIEDIKDLLNIKYINGNIEIYKYKKTERPRTVWINSKYDANEYGSKLVKKITGVDFPYPKSLYTVKDSIYISLNEKKDAIILDFFAGSGTTGHAVLELNKEDGGNRRFILVTNNEMEDEKEKEFKKKYDLTEQEFLRWKRERRKEWIEWEEKYGICTSITYPRIKKVMEGYPFEGTEKEILYEKKITFRDLKKIDIYLDEINALIEERKKDFDEIKKEFKNNILKITGIKKIESLKEGLGGNLLYFKTDLIKKSKNRDQVKYDLTQKATEMLCVKENIYNLIKESDDYKIFSSNRRDKYMGIYYNIYDDGLNEFIEELKKIKEKKVIYMFSLDNSVNHELFKDIDNYVIEPIPQKILDVYNYLIKMNIPIKRENIYRDLDKAKNQIFDQEDKDTAGKTLRIILAKIIQSIAKKHGMSIINEKGKEIRIGNLNDMLKRDKIISDIEWSKNKTFLTIGNEASHGHYTLEDIKDFYKYIHSLIEKYNI